MLPWWAGALSCIQPPRGGPEVRPLVSTCSRCWDPRVPTCCLCPQLWCPLSALWAPCAPRPLAPSPSHAASQTQWAALRCLLRLPICLDLTLSLLSLWLLMVAQGTLRHCPKPEIPQSNGPRLSLTQEVYFVSWGPPYSPRVTHNRGCFLSVLQILSLLYPKGSFSPVLGRKHFPLFRE